MTVGEYLDPEVDPREWDIRGLARWAESRFGSTITQNQLRNMSIEEVHQHLIEAGEAKIDNYDLKPIERFMDPLYGTLSLINWARQKFGANLRPDDFVELSNDEITARLIEAVHDAYREREIRYPIEVALERTILREGPENAYAADALAQWANLKFNLGWTVDSVRSQSVKEIAEKLITINREYCTNDKLHAEIDQAIGNCGLTIDDPDASADADGESTNDDRRSSTDRLAEWAKQRFGPAFHQETFDESTDVRETLRVFAVDLLRRELSVLERFVLLEIYDQSWKDHMHAIDLLKESIGLRGFAEQDPKIAYKREGFQMFQEMMEGIRDKVTGIIFKARLTEERAFESRYNIAAVQHADATNQGFTGTGQVDRDRAAAMRAQGEQKVETIRREQPRVGRNTPCPCGSGKKFKQCHGKGK
ncbi:MAG: SEC-C metal-binding domain-containing protein [Planctomycetota bacterium]